MEKTIEERAISAAIADTAKGRTREDYIISAMADHENGFRGGYIKGATEQKDIDEDHFREAKKMLIDKACKWLEERTMFGVHPCSGMGLVMEFRNMFMED